MKSEFFIVKNKNEDGVNVFVLADNIYTQLLWIFFHQEIFCIQLFLRKTIREMANRTHSSKDRKKYT